MSKANIDLTFENAGEQARIVTSTWYQQEVCLEIFDSPDDNFPVYLQMTKQETEKLIEALTKARDSLK